MIESAQQQIKNWQKQYSIDQIRSEAQDRVITDLRWQLETISDYAPNDRQHSHECRDIIFRQHEHQIDVQQRRIEL